jgi:hypothetical protein
MKKRFLYFISILVLLMLACNLTSVGGTQPTPAGNAPAPAETPQSGGDLPFGQSQPAGTPEANPVSINNGLGSLNSYVMRVEFKASGSAASDTSNILVETSHSKDLDATLTHYTMTSVSEGETEPSTNESYMYSIGNDRCSGSGEDWSWNSYSPEQAEMMDLFKSMIGLTPLIDNPTFVGEEMVNGIPSNHFTFKAPGLGVTSGANVAINQGDYWLAVDGRYIVKYVLIIEENTDPQTMIHTEISIDLTQINQPVSIAFPQGCLDASLVTPEP